MQRVVGILTEALEMRRQARENPEGDAIKSEAVAALLEEMLPRIELPADASAHEVATAVSRTLGPAIVQIASAFALAFVQLAEVHEARHADVSAADILQSISLHFETEAGG